MPTLQQYRQAVAASEDLGGYIPFASTSASSATNEVICSALATDETPNPSSRHAGAWLLGVSGGSSAARAGEQRIVRQLGFTGSTGALLTTRAYGSTPPNAHNWEMYYRIPAIRDENGREGYREIINTALSRMPVEGFISLDATTDVLRYTLDLSIYPFLRENGRILGLHSTPANTTERRPVEANHWGLILNNEVAEFQLTTSGYRTGTTFDLKVIRPANSRLKISGSWANQASPLAGLVNDADEAIPPVNTVVAVARELCFLQLSKGNDSTKDWKALALEAGRIAAAYKFDDADGDDMSDPLLVSGNVDFTAWR